MQRYLVIIFLCLFSASNFSTEEVTSSSNLKLPEYSSLGKRIAEGEAVYVDTFYWITSDGEIKKTDRGWSRVPKSRRHLVYLSQEEALAELYEPEDIVAIPKNKDPFTIGPIRYIEDLYTNNLCIKQNGAIRDCQRGEQYLGYAAKQKAVYEKDQQHIYNVYKRQGGRNLLGLFPGKRCEGEFNAFTWHKCVGTNAWLGKCNSASKTGLYVGEFLDGRPDGKGYRICATESNRNTKNWLWTDLPWRYYGDWKDGVPHGEGYYFWDEGSYYFGEVKEGRPNGKGEAKDISDGGNYSGQWKDGVPSGQGTYTWKNGSKSIGNWSNGYRHGKHVMTNASGVIYFEGMFKKGSRTGYATKLDDNGSKYVGNLLKNKKQGHGTKYFSDGSKYVGTWKDDKTEGAGIFYRNDNSIVGGLWGDDQFVKGFSNDQCVGDKSTWSDCVGTLDSGPTITYIGQFLDGKLQGGVVKMSSNNYIYVDDIEKITQSKPKTSKVAKIPKTGFEASIPLDQAGMYITIAEECQRRSWMRFDDSKLFIKSVEQIIKSAISRKEITRDQANQSYRMGETLIAMGGFGYEQKEMCQMFTLLTQTGLRGQEERF